MNTITIELMNTVEARDIDETTRAAMIEAAKNHLFPKTITEMLADINRDWELSIDRTRALAAVESDMTRAALAAIGLNDGEHGIHLIFLVNGKPFNINA